MALLKNQEYIVCLCSLLTLEWINNIIQTYKIWSGRFYTINVFLTGKKLDDTSYRGYFVVYAATTGVNPYWNSYPLFLSTDTTMLGLINIIIFYP